MNQINNAANVSMCIIRKMFRMENFPSAFFLAISVWADNVFPWKCSIDRKRGRRICSCLAGTGAAAKVNYFSIENWDVTRLFRRPDGKYVGT